MRILERLPRETGREYALRVLKDNIIHLDLVPGSMISENELAAQLSLSRTPVREALIELAKGKIVEVYPQRGSVVSLIDYNLVEEARFMRNVLECAVVQLDCEMITPEWSAKLEENIKLQEFYLENRSPVKLLDLDNEFHQILFDMANKPQIYLLMESITIHFDRVRSMSLSTVKELKLVSDHRAIVDAIKAGDKETAKNEMEKHLSRYKIDEQALRSEYNQYFKPE
jgi:DNA-binding GntR family transcriptional regulator